MTTRSAVAPALLLLILGLLLFPLAQPAGTQPAATQTAGAPATALFDGRELGDFELTGEFEAAPGTHASLMLRGAARVGLDAATTTGWSSLSIRLVGERATIAVGGRTQQTHTRLPHAIDKGAALPPRGPIVVAGAPVKWRNLKVREIDGAEANRLLAQHDSAGFVSAFDGRTFNGWAGPLENYQIVDGAILCKPGSGGTIHTTKEYGDFAVRLEIQVPPGGNNGLAIRYPGKGDAAYVGMTELQVLDNTAEKYASLDPRQFHGSAYGMVAAKKGYQRPVGEWNFQEVIVRGSSIVVELNGTRILDANLRDVTSVLDDKPHPGKDRTSGHFGFAGHGDPVRFRHVQIKPL